MTIPPIGPWSEGPGLPEEEPRPVPPDWNVSRGTFISPERIQREVLEAITESYFDRGLEARVVGVRPAKHDYKSDLPFNNQPVWFEVVARVRKHSGETTHDLIALAYHPDHADVNIFLVGRIGEEWK